MCIRDSSHAMHTHTHTMTDMKSTHALITICLLLVAAMGMNRTLWVWQSYFVIQGVMMQWLSLPALLLLLYITSSFFLVLISISWCTIKMYRTHSWKSGHGRSTQCSKGREKFVLNQLMQAWGVRKTTAPSLTAHSIYNLYQLEVKKSG